MSSKVYFVLLFQSYTIMRSSRKQIKPPTPEQVAWIRRWKWKKNKAAEDAEAIKIKGEEHKRLMEEKRLAEVAREHKRLMEEKRLAEVAWEQKTAGANRRARVNARAKRHDLVIVSMFKNESWILKEWIEHHIEMGVGHFYLIDNGSTDNYRDILAPYQERGLVTLVVDPRRIDGGEVCVFDTKENRIKKVNCEYAHTQTVLANQHFLEIIKREARWVMYIDQDEYVFSTRSTLKFLLDSVSENAGHIWMPWRIFGSSNLIKQPASVRQSFRYRGEHNRLKEMAISHGNIAGHGKSITRVSSLTMLNIHRCSMTNNDVATPDGKLFPSTSRACKEFREWFETYAPNPEIDLVCCNHYATMSKEYMMKCKCKRQRGCGPGGGGGGGNVDFDRYWGRFDANDIHDTWILSAVKEI